MTLADVVGVRGSIGLKRPVQKMAATRSRFFAAFTTIQLSGRQEDATSQNHFATKAGQAGSLNAVERQCKTILFCLKASALVPRLARPAYRERRFEPALSLNLPRWFWWMTN